MYYTLKKKSLLQKHLAIVKCPGNIEFCLNLVLEGNEWSVGERQQFMHTSWVDGTLDGGKHWACLPSFQHTLNKPLDRDAWHCGLYGWWCNLHDLLHPFKGRISQSWPSLLCASARSTRLTLLWSKWFKMSSCVAGRGMLLWPMAYCIARPEWTSELGLRL